MTKKGDVFGMESYEIPRHRVFISYHQANDLMYKEMLEGMTEWNPDREAWQSIFEDFSVCQDDIEDEGKTDEEIWREIRSKYIKDATVLILLCGEETRHRKFVDREIHAAMYDGAESKKMGILVINVLPAEYNQATITIDGDDVEVIDVFGKARPIGGLSGKDLDDDFPYMPERIKENLVRENVRIPVVNWTDICGDLTYLKRLIDDAHGYRTGNAYDHDTPLRRRNS